ncbi:MAG: glycosyltransferase family 1 protein [Pseudomonadota bacterium]
MTRPILYLDISRLVRRYEHFGGPTGMDRIEWAYLTRLFRQDRMEPRAVARSRDGLVVLREDAARTVLSTMNARWGEATPRQFGRNSASALVHGARVAKSRMGRWSLLKGARPLVHEGRPSVTLNVAHDGLDVASRFSALPGAFAVLVSDLIPLTHPEYDTERATALHGARMATVAKHADHVFTISEATRQALLAHLGPVRFSHSVAHLGPALAMPDDPIVYERPTFVHLSSLDRRKNVALLLHTWREMAESGWCPDLVLIGRRGNDGTVLEMIDRCTALDPHVRVLGGVSDRDAARHLAGARALLSASFAEGYGLPIVEAQAFGVPAIASDIAAHREIGGASTLFLDPTDGPSWRKTIERLARDDEAHARLVNAIVPPHSWDDHVAKVMAQVEGLAR